MPNSISNICLAAPILCCFSLLLNSDSLFAHANEADRLSLLAIKSQLQDPLGVTSSWNNSINLCQWAGVTCGHRHQRVTGLDLRNQSVGGVLSPFVGNLSFLRSINLANSSFRGEIPHEVGNLFRLQNLTLTNNYFSGKIPTNLSRCSNLMKFEASNNKLEGEIPSEIGNLLKLKILNIAENHLTGQLPASIGNLSALQKIEVRGNRLSGRIPSTISHLRKLISLHVGSNQFSGMFPPIYNISSLEYIFINRNRFHGSLPHDIGANLPNLRYFIISGNNLTGSLQDSLSNATNLQKLDINRNLFSGKVSINFSRLQNLSWLNLGKNNLGTVTANDLDFITLLTNCTKLEVLDLDSNRFGGVLPFSLTNLSRTTTAIAIGNNQISGTIPDGIANLLNLNGLGLEFNQFAGTIPRAIGELKSLQILYLHENFLHGTSPSTLGNLTLLSQLLLEVNNLQGNIPPSLGNCQNLMLLTTRKNKLSGILPRQLLRITTLSVSLDLSNNFLSGHFPAEVGNLKHLVSLDISSNMFSGEIPNTLGGCTSLEHLSMQGNSFTGSIPSTLSSLKSIEELDLSHNNLSGHIPQYLENLSFLSFLNLSYNHFEGKVPIEGIFNSTKGISLAGNEHLCGGLDELHLSPCPSAGSRKSKLSILIKVVIPVTVLCLILAVCFIIVCGRRRRSAQKSSNKLPMEQQYPMVSYAQLSKATNNFSSSNLIGQGSFGFVYKGIFGENEMIVAVKVINLKQKGASRSFVAECDALRSIRHRNLIKIITLCSSIDYKGDDFKALVYEYMESGSLEKWLHWSNDQPEMCTLSLIQRLNIVIDVASAIEYLHHHCQPPIVHGDLKPSNVLLDQEMVAHVGDFGLARILSDQPLGTAPQTESSSTGIKGTVGYVAPEYGTGSAVSMPGDVYSFGILLLEMLTRRRPTDDMFNDGLTLHEFAKMALPEGVMEIVEPSLSLEVRTGNSGTRENGRAKVEECLVALVGIGVLCSTESATQRIEMTEVVSKLCDARDYFVGTEA